LPPSPLKPRGGGGGQALQEAELVSLDKRLALELPSDDGMGTCALVGAPSEEPTASGPTESRQTGQSWAKDEDEDVRG